MRTPLSRSFVGFSTQPDWTTNASTCFAEPTEREEFIRKNRETAVSVVLVRTENTERRIRYSFGISLKGITCWNLIELPLLHNGTF
ncbi:hypothetical protein GWI33_014845 [Rhynchophorus ferrugineus]|uniref:Uncharacterized protein n=1 Tax=Rhynchophorus ferrugineus TaxID=354439 RepID=A0A834I0L7_RHYFE|nr:hypothetical protein GWI33_014845 [Rhynchophorus ferrugineus]